jgi:hypothetical protein
VHESGLESGPAGSLSEPLNPHKTGKGQIWRTSDSRTWVDTFTEFGIELFESGLDFAQLPEGYGLVAHLFDWEAQCSFDAWMAIENRKDTLPEIIESYRRVGLIAEAQGLTEAIGAWKEHGLDHDAIGKAYGSVENRHKTEMDRLEYLACYFVENADGLFYLPESKT